MAPQFVEPPWKVSENGPEAYERYIVPAWMGAWAQDLVEALGVRPGDRVLDVACGTGIVARKAAALAGPGALVCGFDSDAGMLDSARRHALEEGLPDLRWRQGRVEALPFDGAAFDVAACQHGLQFFPDRPAALREMHRVLAPGGRLGVSVWRSLDRCPFLAIVAGYLERRLGIQPQAFHASCALSDREELRRLIREAGFAEPRIRLESRISRHPSLAALLPGYLSVFPPAAAFAALTPAQRADFFRGLAEALAPFTDDDGLAAPMECHLAIAVKP